jgi:DNA-binding MarR family transcriptional regulator
MTLLQSPAMVNISRLVDSLSHLHTLERDLTLTRVMLLLHVAKATATGEDDPTLADLEQVLDIPQPSVSKNVLALTERGVYKGLPGLGLLRTYDDPADLRLRRVAMTEKGKKLVAKLLHELE